MMLAPAATFGTAYRLKPVFTEGREDICPCCNGRAWHVGRITAECAACEAALPIARLGGVLPASPANRADWNSARAAMAGWAMRSAAGWAGEAAKGLAAAAAVEPRREHSRKPDRIAGDIVRLLGDLPRAELFARTQRPGWDCWGNEASKFEVAV